MDTSNTRVEERLNELEIKASFTEDLVEQLNQIIIRQQQDLDASGAPDRPTARATARAGYRAAA